MKKESVAVGLLVFAVSALSQTIPRAANEREAKLFGAVFLQAKRLEVASTKCPQVRRRVNLLESLRKAGNQASESAKEMARFSSPIFEKVALKDYDEHSKEANCGTKTFQSYYESIEEHFDTAFRDWSRR